MRREKGGEEVPDIRSRNTGKHYKAKKFFKTLIALALVLIIVCGVGLFLLAKMYYTDIYKRLENANDILVSSSYRATIGKGEMYVSRNPEGGIIYTSYTENDVSYKFFFRNGKCYMNIEPILTPEERSIVNYKSWVAVDASKVYKTGTYEPASIFSCVNTLELQEATEAEGILKRGLNNLNYILKGKVADEFGAMDKEKIVITNVKTNFEEGSFIDLIGECDRRVGEISRVEIGGNYTTVDGDLGSITVTKIGGANAYEGLSKTIDSISIDLASAGKAYEDKFFNLYVTRDKIIIDSLKGAFNK